MINNKTRFLAGLALGCVLSTPVLAEQYSGAYFSIWGGAGMTDLPSRSTLDEYFNLDPSRPGASKLDDTTTAWGALIGYRFNKWLGAEVGYVNLGEAKYDFSGVIGTPSGDASYIGGYRFSSAGPSAAVVGFMPVGEHVEFNARAGVFYGDTRQTIRFYDVALGENVGHDRSDASQTELFAGIGATWNISQSLAVRAEYQRFFDVGDDEKNYEQDIDVISVGVLFK
jgi:OmpA-OmpF porin, OOP family